MDRLGMQYRGLETWYGESLATHALSREDWTDSAPWSRPDGAGCPDDWATRGAERALR